MNTIIEKFTSDRNIALIGVSSDQKKFGNAILRELVKKGYTLFPVHPSLKEVEGIHCIPDVHSLPENVTNLILIVNPAASEQIVSRLGDSPIRRVWMHRGSGKGSASSAAIDSCRTAGIEVVYGFCPMMFFSPSGIHQMHFWLRKKFGNVPAEFFQ